ncbi:MAG TPA: enoyl-CoA hydratase [Aeromicrobium sp.]|nr:enoyl-CoA hydratase [Aeromicrobium sp.]
MTLVEFESRGDVRIITINDPDRRNALSWPLLDAFKSAVESVKEDTDARAVVVRGNGKAFCAGADLADLFGDLSRPVDELRDHLLKVYGCFLGLRDLTIPTVAAVQGAAVGAGLNIALACDVIIAGPQARFGPTFSQIGLHPGGGCTWMLTQRIGAAHTAAALYKGDLIEAEEAVQIGLAQELVEHPKDRSLELATSWAARDPELMANIKRSIAVASSSTFEDSLAVEASAQAVSLKSEQFAAFAARFSR